MELNDLLNKGLTGREAGLLVFKDKWRGYEGRLRLFSDNEVTGIIDGLASQNDRDDFIRMIELMQYAAVMLQETILNCMSTAYHLMSTTCYVQSMCGMSLSADMISMRCNPVNNTMMSGQGVQRAKCLDGWVMPPITDDESGFNVQGGLDVCFKLTMNYLQAFMAGEMVIQELSTVLGFDLLQGISEESFDHLEWSLIIYNIHAVDLTSGVKYKNRKISNLSEMDIDGDDISRSETLKAAEYSFGSLMAEMEGYPQLKPIKLENTQPNEKHVQEYRASITEYLGENWWKPEPKWEDTISKDVMEYQL